MRDKGRRLERAAAHTFPGLAFLGARPAERTKARRGLSQVSFAFELGPLGVGTDKLVIPPTGLQREPAGVDVNR